MKVKSIMGFVLPCRVCGEKHIVGETREFIENGTNRKLTAYWHADADEGDKLIGVSEGNGGTYECMPCHAVKWAEEVAEMKNAPLTHNSERP